MSPVGSAYLLAGDERHFRATMSDLRTAAIRLTSTLPKGSVERRALLEVLAGAKVVSHLARLNLPPNRWVVTRPNVLDSEQRDRVYELYSISYGTIGKQVTGVHALLNDFELMWAKDIDANGTIDAFIAYKRTAAGNKPIMLGSDGSSAAKRSMLSHMMGFLKRRGWYAELSGRPAEIADAAGVPKIMDEAVVRAVLKKDIQWLGDGGYIRQITGVGAHEKSLYGNPKVDNSVEVLTAAE